MPLVIRHTLIWRCPLGQKRNIMTLHAHWFQEPHKIQVNQRSEDTTYITVFPTARRIIPTGRISKLRLEKVSQLVQSHKTSRSQSKHWNPGLPAGWAGTISLRPQNLCRDRVFSAHCPWPLPWPFSHPQLHPLKLRIFPWGDSQSIDREGTR
jgi:hypothetical protein